MVTEDRDIGDKVPDSGDTDTPLGRGDVRRQAIQEAAIEEFSSYGIAGASMSRIASAAGVSRPALYQYFDNRDDLFASAFVSLFDRQVDEALSALAESGPTADRLDGFLQRFDGDLWERMAASVHIDEIIGAKTGEVAVAVHDRLDRLQKGLAKQLAGLAPGNSRAMKARRTEWTDLLYLSPKGLRADQPEPGAYRRRLTALARSVASEIDSIRSEMSGLSMTESR